MWLSFTSEDVPCQLTEETYTFFSFFFILLSCSNGEKIGHIAALYVKYRLCTVFGVRFTLCEVYSCLLLTEADREICVVCIHLCVCMYECVSECVFPVRNWCKGVNSSFLPCYCQNSFYTQRFVLVNR